MGWGGSMPISAACTPDDGGSHMVAGENLAHAIDGHPTVAWENPFISPLVVLSLGVIAPALSVARSLHVPVRSAWRAGAMRRRLFSHTSVGFSA